MVSAALSTPLGATVYVVDLPGILDSGELAGGCMLMVDILDPTGWRHAEVALSLKNMETLRHFLEVL